MRIEGNLMEVKEKQALPGGKYNAIMHAPKEIKKSSTGRDMMEFSAQIIDPVGPDFWTNIKHYITKQDTIGWASFGMKEIADACGIHYDAAGFDTDDIEGKQVVVVVEQEIYKDRTQNKIAHFLKPV